MDTGPPPVGDDVRRWISLGLGPGAAEVLAEVPADLGGDAHDVLWRQYVRAMAHHGQGRLPECLELVRAALVRATPAPDGGAEGALRLLRAAVSTRLGRDRDVVADLAAAEVALRRTGDPGVRSWNAFGFAWACLQLGLHELVASHLGTVDLADPFVPELPVLVALTRSASARDRGADADLAGEPGADALREEATGHALAASRLATLLALPTWTRQAAVARVLATWPQDPAGAVAAIPALLDHQESHPVRGELTAALVAALGLLGRAAEGRAAGEAALAEHAGTLDPREEAAVRRALLLHPAAHGDPVAVDALALVRAQDRELVAARRRVSAALAVALRADQLAAAHLVEHRAARQDALTGVGNRRTLDEALDAAAVTGAALAVVVVDVDDFKAVNDTHGHAGGDEVLVLVADLLAARGRAEDVVCRTGGDEFVLLAPGLDHRGARGLAGSLVADLAAATAAAPRDPVRGTRVSVGSAATSEGLAVAELLRAADLRMYGAKRARGADGPGVRPRP